MEAYRTVEGHAQAEIEEKKSKFIARVKHVETEDEALEFLALVKGENPKARHNVCAYILRRDNRVRYSDDGEPQKTAGLPTLSVLQHAGLTDVACVVTRYFGGTLLGTGGLVRAYTQSTQDALASAQVVEFTPCRDLFIEVEYPQYDSVAHFLSEKGIHVVETQFTNAVAITVRALSQDAQPLADELVDFTQGRAEILIEEEAYRPMPVEQ